MLYKRGDDIMAFADKLRTLRLENNMTQEYVAERMNMARSTIAGYETKNRQPSHEKLTAFANLFHVSIDYLLNDESTEIILAESRELSDDARDLLIRYQRLSIRSKKDLFKQLHLLELRDEEHGQGPLH
jgi:transcriptional regulator with XRE-family HTH domain